MAIKNDLEIVKSVKINAPIDMVWHAWTIPNRLSTWFAPKCNIDARVEGAYELFFNVSDEKSMSTNGCKISKLVVNDTLQFTWKGPDHLASIMNNEDQLTIVTVKFEEIGNETLITVIHSGWQLNDQWKQAFEWHQMAWNGVLQSLKSCMENGIGDLCCAPQ